ncbi:Septin and tuftelin-interacting protein 1 [Citrus sinensis]|uniref:Septin and tuftelin-interacting protein 1 n=1 Tax=Citrus sinensis TaxID=2711 RepID=A0ACB8N8C5_CITSI|nr:Septin and tuftelin-interacting protein 1 [Citrus sinensis]
MDYGTRSGNVEERRWSKQKKGDLLPVTGLTNLKIGENCKENEKEKEKNAATAADTMARTLTLESLADYLSDLKKRVYLNHWLLYFNPIARSLASPLFKRVFQGWDPLQNPSHGLELNVVKHQYWDAREVEPMLKFLDSWKNLLPSSVLDTILDTVVMPKVSSVVNSWNSSSETDPIHVLVQSWMQILGQKREGSYQMILIKLGEVTLQELEINPANQKLDQFNWVTSWASDIPIHLMADLMLGFFFTKWLQELLPQEILENESIRARLAIGLDMIAEAADGAKLDPAGYLLKPTLLNQIKQFEAPQIAAA